MESLHHPATRLLAWIQAAGMSCILASWSHMGYVLALGDRLLRLVANIGRISAHMLWSLFTRLWTRNHDGIQGGRDEPGIMHIGPLHRNRQRSSMPITELTALGPAFAAIGGIGSGRGSAERGFRHHSIQALPLPLDAFQFVILLQPGLPEGLEEPLLFPQSEPIIHGG
jgi:hypothetical protein